MKKENTDNKLAAAIPGRQLRTKTNHKFKQVQDEKWPYYFYIHAVHLMNQF